MGVRGPWGTSKTAVWFAFPQVTHLQIGSGPLPWHVQAPFHRTPGTRGGRTMALSSTIPPAICREQISNLNSFLPENVGSRPALRTKSILCPSSRSKEIAWEECSKERGFPRGGDGLLGRGEEGA